jgi:hypothetical protein
MAWQGTVYKVLIASPADVPAERAALPDVLHNWNAFYGEQYGVVFHPVMWETHSRPDMSGDPQTILNAQIVDGCDAVLAAFWTRLGTRTETAVSGTAEEIRRCREQNKPVMVYFSNAPVRPDSIDSAEYERLKAFKAECQSSGLYDEYDSVGQLQEKVSRHLTLLARDLEAGCPVGSSAQRAPVAADEARAAGLAALEGYRRFVAEIRASWRAERAADPVNSDSGMAILAKAFSGLVSFSSYRAISDDAELQVAVDGLLARLRVLQAHSFYIDGGVSWRAFWDGGDAALVDLASLESSLRDKLS